MMNDLLKILSAVGFLAFISCTDPVEGSKIHPSLSVEYPAMSIGYNSKVTVAVTGGKPPYIIKSISDSTLANVSLVKDWTQTLRYVTVTSHAISGPLTVVVTDSSGSTGTISINIVEFAVFPGYIDVQEYSSTQFRFQGGVSPYTIENVYDTSVVTATTDFALQIFGRKAGRTVLTISDSSPQKKRTTVWITVTPRFSSAAGEMAFNSTFGEHRYSGTYVGLNGPTEEGFAAGLSFKDWSETFQGLLFSGSRLVSGGKKIEYLTIIMATGNGLLHNGTYPVTRSSSMNSDASEIQYDVNDTDSLGDLSYYNATDGEVTITNITSERISGTFRGKGYLITSPNGVDSSKSFEFWNGSFDGPYYTIISHLTGEPKLTLQHAPDIAQRQIFLTRYRHRTFPGVRNIVYSDIRQ